MLILTCDKCDQRVMLGGAYGTKKDDNWVVGIDLAYSVNTELSNWAYISLVGKHYNLCPTHCKEWLARIQELEKENMEKKEEFFKESLEDKG